MKKRLAFTLGEILIALGVIGVVAALVIPQLINGKKAGTARAQFDTAYSILSKTFADMDADNIPIMPANYTTSNSLYTQMKNYSRVAIDCGNYSAQKNISVCIARGANDQSGNIDNYKIYNPKSNSKMNSSLLDDGAFVLTNGMLVAIENPGGTTKVDNKDVPNMILVSVDINGKNKNPNRWGWDLFTFELTNQGLLPVGADGTQATYSDDPQTYCKLNGAGNTNGITCSYYATMNQDYFKNLYKGY